MLHKLAKRLDAVLVRADLPLTVRVLKVSVLITLYLRNMTMLSS